MTRLYCIKNTPNTRTSERGRKRPPAPLLHSKHKYIPAQGWCPHPQRCTHLVTADALVLKKAVHLLHALDLRPSGLPDVHQESIQLISAELLESHQLSRDRHREPATHKIHSSLISFPYEKILVSCLDKTLSSSEDNPLPPPPIESHNGPCEQQPFDNKQAPAQREGRNDKRPSFKSLKPPPPPKKSLSTKLLE